MGLLDNMQQPQQQMGGLLGGQPQAMPPQGMPTQGAPPQQSSGLQMAMQLAQNPTPEMAKQIIQKLQESGNRESGQFEQMISKVIGDPQKLKQLADAIVQKLSGAQQ